MNDYDLAGQAKREGKFDLAIEYYQKVMNQEGVSIKLLQAVANVFYLKEFNDEAVAFGLAAAHLSLHIDNERYKKKDPATVNALKQIPEEITNQFPKPIGALLLYHPDIVRNISHALLDQEIIFEKEPKIRPFAEIYYAQLLGDGSETETLQKYNLTGQDVLHFEEQEYIGYGYQVVIDEIKWTELERTDVAVLYVHGQ